MEGLYEFFKFNLRCYSILKIKNILIISINLSFSKNILFKKMWKISLFLSLHFPPPKALPSPPLRTPKQSVRGNHDIIELPIGFLFYFLFIWVFCEIQGGQSTLENCQVLQVRFPWFSSFLCFYVEKEPNRGGLYCKFVMHLIVMCFCWVFFFFEIPVHVILWTQAYSN